MKAPTGPMLVLKQPRLGEWFTSQTTGFAGSTWLDGSHRAEAFPAAIRELLQHHQHSATNVRRLATRRFDIRGGEGMPLDCPSTIQKRQVLGFRNVAEQLDLRLCCLAFVASSDSLLTDFRRLANADMNSVISP